MSFHALFSSKSTSLWWCPRNCNHVDVTALILSGPLIPGSRRDTSRNSEIRLSRWLVFFCIRVVSDNYYLRAFQFSSRWCLCARKSPYALHPVSQKFPRRCLWNGSNVRVTDDGNYADIIAIICFWRCYIAIPWHRYYSSRATENENPGREENALHACMHTYIHTCFRQRGAITPPLQTRCAFHPLCALFAPNGHAPPPLRL